MPFSTPSEGLAGVVGVLNTAGAESPSPIATKVSKGAAYVNTDSQSIRPFRPSLLRRTVAEIEARRMILQWNADEQRAFWEPERKNANKMAPQVGFEPTTNRLTADRSTTELLRSVERGWSYGATICNMITQASLELQADNPGLDALILLDPCNSLDREPVLNCSCIRPSI